MGEVHAMVHVPTAASGAGLGIGLAAFVLNCCVLGRQYMLSVGSMEHNLMH